MEFQASDAEDNESEIVQFNHSRRVSKNNNAVIDKRKEAQNISMEEGEIEKEIETNAEGSDSEQEMEVDSDQGSSDDEVLEAKADPGKGKGRKRDMQEEFLDEAMNRFHEVFMSSGFIQTTADLVQRKMKDSQASQPSKQAKEISEDHGERERYMNQTDSTKHVSRGNNKEGKEGSRSHKESHHSSQGGNNVFVIDPKISNLLSKASMSELTVYKNAVENQINKRTSSSSEEFEEGDLSDEVEQYNNVQQEGQVDSRNQNLIDEFISDVRKHHRHGDNFMVEDPHPQPSTSGYHRHQAEGGKDENYLEIWKTEPGSS